MGGFDVAQTGAIIGGRVAPSLASSAAQSSKERSGVGLCPFPLKLGS